MTNVLHELNVSDMGAVSGLFESMSIDDLLRCKTALQNCLTKAFATKEQEIKSMHPTDFVAYEECFLKQSSVLYHAVSADIEALNLKPSGDHPITKWLTTTNLEYSWETQNGNVTVKHPTDLSKSAAIFQLMTEINEVYKVDMNSCLVGYYKNGRVKARYHDDKEREMDPKQPIICVSLGAVRSVDFIRKGQDRRTKPLHSINTADGSIYIMKQGCQDYFEHRVRTSNDVTEGRFCLSFRRILSKDELPVDELPPPPPSSSPISPVKSTIQFFENGGTPSFVTAPLSQSAPLSQPVCGLPRKQGGPKKRQTTVLFGTSITYWVKPNKVAAHGGKFVNMSQRGAKIVNIKQNVQEFYEQHEAAKTDDVEKIIFSLGTNDIKYSKRGVAHLKKFLVSLINVTKNLFPAAIILFQCCLPIRNMYTYTVRNVLDFNGLLMDLCYDFNCVYIDCFKDFLTNDGKCQDRALFSDWLHFNGNGYALITAWFKFIVNLSSYDRVVTRPFHL